MKKNLAVICGIFAIFMISAVAQSPAKYWVQFTDKANSEFSIDKPEQFLSARAIANRQKYNIAIDETDLPVNQNYVDSILRLDSSNRLFTKSKWLNGITIYSEDSAMLDKLKAVSFVQFCEYTIKMDTTEQWISEPYVYKNGGVVAKNMPALPLDLQYGKAEKQNRLNNIHWLHRLGFTGDGMVMMVMDGGFHNVDSIDFFNDLRNENRILGVRNFVELGADLFRDGSHGTMVLSCIAANTPKKLVGTAPRVQVYLAQTEDGRTENKIEEDNWVAGIEWADSLGVAVLNSSLGYTKFDDSTHLRTYIDLNGTTSRASQAATLAAKKGIIVCNSAGNEGAKAWHYVGCPAEAKDILAVGATTLGGVKATFSSFGPTADGRVKPDIAAAGAFVWVSNKKGKSVTSNGTSFASPILAGMVTCLWQAFPEKTNMEIMDAVRQSGSQAAAPDSALGNGVADFLRAYNYLKTSSLTNSEDEIAFVEFPTFSVKKNDKEFTFYINSTQKQEIVVTYKCRKTNYSSTKKRKLNKGSYEISFKLPRDLADSYDFIDLTIDFPTEQRQYLIGIE